jgi:glyoxylase-like metal-dependent hydrolase (beta-lactamase superfamily II)
MYLEVSSDNPYGTNCWMISADGSDEAIVVDPGFEAAKVHAILRASGKSVVAALATHGHIDHIGAADAFCGDELPLYIHESDALALTDPVAWGSGGTKDPVPVKTIRTLADGDLLDFAGFAIKVVHTPGHTPGSVCFLTDGWVLSGDLVFAGSIGRHDLPNSSADDMRESLRRFLELSDALDVFPGHGPRTTVDRERRTNPFLAEL